MAQSKNLLFRIPAATPSVRESNEFQAIKAGMISIDAKLYEALTTLNGNALTEVNALIAQSQALLRDGVSSDGDTLAKLRTLLTLQNQISNSLDLTSVKLATGNQAGGYPVLDSGGKVASAQLPSFVDDVLEHVSLAAFPGTGEVGKIYVALDTNKTYRWSGSVYVYITSGAVDSVAGKTGIVTVTQSDVGLGNVNNTSDLNKPISIDQQIAIMMAESNAKAASTPVGHIGTGNDSHALVNSGVAGFMSAADKIKLDAISGSNTGDETTVTIRSKLGISTLSGANTGDQTTIIGNAGSATKLQTARLINGVPFDGTDGITINAVDSTPRVATSLLAVANGVATLDGAGKVPSNQLPAYIDDVLEFINLAAFPATGEAGKIYVALDTNKTYRWGGSSYIYITSGAVDSVAGKNGVVTLNKTDVGLDNVDNTADSVKYVHHSSIAARTELVTCNLSQVSPGPAAFTDLTGLDAYQSTDFPGSYYSGFTSMEGSGHRGIQFVGSWNCETGQVPFAYIRGKDDSQGNWGTWTEFVLNNGRQYSIHISGNADTATALQTARLINGIPFNGTTDIALTKSSIGLGNVDNTADANKPVSTAQSTAINAAQANAIAASTPVTHIGTGSTAHAAVTTSSNGFMSAADKIKLDAISGSNTGDETTATIKSKLGITTLSGSNTGDQTTVTGNAGTATALQTARTINGVSFNGTANITINAVDATARVASSLLGVVNGVATLDAVGKVPSTQLPSYVDDVVEGTNLAAFPGTGETGKIYIAIDTNKSYRWSGSTYVYITSGAVDSVAGKTGIVTLVKADVGLGNVDNTSDANKPVSTAQATAISNAQSAAIASASTDATTKASNAQAAAIAAAATDATTKADAAQTAAITAASADATTKANAAQAASAPIAHVGATGAAHGAVTSGANGFMSAADKVKLDAVTGTNTGDETNATIVSKIGATFIPNATFATSASTAANATKLATARTINGVSFDGSANITINAVDATARVASSLLGVANGVATLDGSGLIPAIQLPSYVDDVLEFTNLAAFPGTGETGKIYVAIDTNKTYRWTGSVYIAIASGSVDSVAGKTGVVTLVKADVGLGNVDNTSDVNKPVSTAQSSAISTAQSTAISTASSDATTKANAAQAAAIAASAPSTHVGATGAAHGVVTGGINGFMSSADKIKLDAITGTNTGDQTNIAGNAGTAGTATYLSASQQVNTITGKQASMAMVVSDVTPGSFTCRATGAGDANLAGMTFYNDSYALKLGVRADGYFGLGGWSRAAWSWYSAPDGSMVAAGNVTAYSDPRLKENIVPITGAIDILKQINGVRFDWKQGFAHTQCKSGKRDIGILANEVEAVLPELITESIELEGERYKTVAYSSLIPVVIEAFKEMHADVYAELDKVKKQLSELQATIEAMKS